MAMAAPRLEILSRHTELEVWYFVVIILAYVLVFTMYGLVSVIEYGGQI